MHMIVPRLKCTFYEQNLVLQNQPYFSRFMEGEADFRAATRKERLCFAAECGLGRLGHTGTPDGLGQPHEKNGLVLLQNVLPRVSACFKKKLAPSFTPGRCLREAVAHSPPLDKDIRGGEWVQDNPLYYSGLGGWGGAHQE